MVSISFGLVFILAVLYQVDAAPTRQKRSLWELDTVISCYTGRSGFDYNGYGCWCGLGGSGRPVDDTDTCCMEHDYCYQSLEDDRCGVYFTSYQYTKQDCESGNGRINCAGSLTDPDPCYFRLCECDRKLASCLRKYRPSYHDVFANYEKRFCEARLAHPVIIYHFNSSSNSSTTARGGDERGAYRQVAPSAGQRDAYQQVDGAPSAGHRGAYQEVDGAPNVGQRSAYQQVDGAPIAAQRGVYQQVASIAGQRGAYQQVDGAPSAGQRGAH